MAPSAMLRNETEAPLVPQRHNIEAYAGHHTPPATSLEQELLEEPEIGQLMSLAESSVIVTGGARGLGLTMAAASVESGADVLCCDVLPEPSQLEWAALEEKAKRKNVLVHYRRLDICDGQAVERAFKEYADQARFPLKGTIHAAGVMDEQLANDYDMHAFRRVLNVNVDGTMIVAKAAARIMRSTGKGGSIVLIASISGSITNRGLTTAAYSSSKSACLQLSRSLAVEWGPDNIRVNTLSPGYIKTAMTNLLLEKNKEKLELWKHSNPLGRIGVPSDLKAPAVFLLSNASNFVTGTDFKIDGGHCCW